MERLSETLPDHKSWKRQKKIGLYHVLLCKSERESDFDIFGCTSECETIRLAISLVCLICNISLLRETRRLVAIPAVSPSSLLWESRSGSAGFRLICCKTDLSLGRGVSSRPVSYFKLLLWGVCMRLAGFLFNEGGIISRLKHHLCKRYCHWVSSLDGEINSSPIT